MNNYFNPMIYAFENTHPEYTGMLKVGYAADQTIEQRIYGNAINEPIKTKLIRFRGKAYDINNKIFNKDFEIHDILEFQMGCERQKKEDENGEIRPTEYFKCTLEQVKIAYDIRYNNEKYSLGRDKYWGMRPNQEKAVKDTMDYFNSHDDKRFLWNAKCRFGKTFTSYQLALKMGWEKILVVTFKPAVEGEWKRDLNTHIDFKDWQFISMRENKKDDIDPTKNLVCFVSLQDLLGTSDGKIKKKNEWIHKEKWDCVIFDEYHFGAWKENTKELFLNENKEEEINEEKVDEEIKDKEVKNIKNKILKIASNYSLYLSGTPFRAIASGEFLEEQIYNWTYIDEQEAKEKWDSLKPENNIENNPYKDMAQIKLMIYNIPNDIRTEIQKSENREFDLSTFFQSNWKKGEEIEKAGFKYDNQIKRWLSIISGGCKIPINILSKYESPYPFEDNYKDKLKHTLWLLPDIASCYAMRNILTQHNFFKDNYKIKVAAGNQAGIGIKALNPVEYAISHNDYTITLSCGKLTTGVTIPEWTGIFMLSNLESTESYFQSAFRVQSPWKIDEDNYKKECYIFDFSLNRALKQVKNYCDKMDPKNEKNLEEKLRDCIHFLPILICNELEIKEKNIDEILFELTSSSIAKNWDNWDNMYIINNNLNDIIDDDIKNILKLIKESKGTQNEDNSITITDSNGGIIPPNNGETNKINKKKEKDEKELTIDEIKKKLIGLIERIPTFLYLSNIKLNTIEDIINSKESDLFNELFEITITNFKKLIKCLNKNLINDMIYIFSNRRS